MATLGGKLVDEERQARLVAAGGRAMDDTLLGRAIEHRKGALEAGLGVAARLGLADATHGRANPRLHGEVGLASLVAGPDALLGGLVMRHQLPPRRDRNRATGAVQTAERPQVSRFHSPRQGTPEGRPRVPPAIERHGCSERLRRSSATLAGGTRGLPVVVDNNGGVLRSARTGITKGGSAPCSRNAFARRSNACRPAPAATSSRTARARSSTSGRPSASTPGCARISRRGARPIRAWTGSSPWSPTSTSSPPAA